MNASPPAADQATFVGTLTGDAVLKQPDNEREI